MKNNYHTELIDTISNTLIIRDGSIVYQLLDPAISITVNKDYFITLVFKAHTKHTIQIICDLTSDLSLNYILETGAHVELIETKLGVEKHGLQKETTIHTHASLNMLSLNHHHHLVLSDHINVLEAASVNAAYCEMDGGNVDASCQIQLKGPHATATLRVAAYLDKKDNKAYALMLNHLAPQTKGDMFNYGVVRDKAQLDFTGIGMIQQGMKQSATHQTSKIMVFDKESGAKANPYLYIYENDVEASHAAGVGKMDEDHLYYLQSRGIKENDAKLLITSGYLKPVIQDIQNDAIKEVFINQLEKRLGGN